MKRNKTQMLLRWPRRLMRITGTILLGAYLVSVVDPVMANVRKGEQFAAQREALAPSATEKLAEQLAALEETLDRMQRRIDGRFEFEWQEIAARRSRATAPAPARRAELAVLEAKLVSQEQAIATLLPQSRTELQVMAEDSARGGAAPEISLRQAADRMSFEEGAARLSVEISAIRQARDDAAFGAALKSAAEWLRSHSSRQQRPRLDPDKLSYGSRGSTVRAPAADAAALRSWFAAELPAGNVPALSGPDTSTRTPAPADLAPTEDVQITAAIRAKAQELGGSPLALYRYVHDTVDFVPSYGSIQGSDYTMQTRRGNAFDQASLLIALLRASNIPARYAYGVVELPVDKVMNWVGGVTAPGAALSLLAQGGIPSLGVTEAGVIKRVRLEHVWVEVWANQFPGGGMRPGPGDNWIALDPSFKQYAFGAGMDLTEEVPFDMQAISQHLEQNATFNEAEGWVQNVDQAYFNAQLADLQQRISAYIEQQNPAATVADVVGSQSIVPLTLRSLPGGLPYVRLLAADPVAVLPQHLRWKFRYVLGEPSFFGDELEDETELLQRSLPSLAGKSLELSFRPTTPADADAYASYLPAQVDGPEDVPLRVPANIVNLTGEFRVDGDVVASVPGRNLGIELRTRKGFFIPGKGWDETDNPLTAGDYQAVSVDMHGFSRAHLRRHEDAVRATRDKLQAQQYDAVKGIEVVRGMLQTAALTYLTLTAAQNTAAAKTSGIVNYRQPSYGTVSLESEAAYLFGVPRMLAHKGFLMDMDRISGTSVSKDGNSQRRAMFESRTGSMASGFEHDVFEKIFGTAESPSEAISAVKALSIATAQNQRIYTITTANLDVALNSIDASADIKRDVTEAVLAGKTVTMHASPLSYQGSMMMGYTVLDPVTGAGGYIIRGADGALASGFVAGVALAGIASFLSVALGVASITVLGIASAIVVGMFLLLLLSILMAWALSEFFSDEQACFWGGFALGLGIGFFLPGGALAGLIAYVVGLLMGVAIPSNTLLQCIGIDGNRPRRAVAA